MELVGLKHRANSLSKSEVSFFGGKERLKKNYLKAFNKKKFESR